MADASLRRLGLGLMLAAILALPVIWWGWNEPSGAPSPPTADSESAAVPVAGDAYLSRSPDGRNSQEIHAVPGAVRCGSCHQVAPHRDLRLNQHAESVACQTCHLSDAAGPALWARLGPSGGDTLADSSAAKDVDAKTDFRISYRWFSAEGVVDNAGQTDGFGEQAQAGIGDPQARIWPFIAPYGRDEGPAPEQRPVSRRITHGAVAKSSALQCMDCHGRDGRLGWSALGYRGNPMRHGGRDLGT